MPRCTHTCVHICMYVGLTPGMGCRCRYRCYLSFSLWLTPATHRPSFAFLAVAPASLESLGVPSHFEGASVPLLGRPDNSLLVVLGTPRDRIPFSQGSRCRAGPGAPSARHVIPKYSTLLGVSFETAFSSLYCLGLNCSSAGFVHLTGAWAGELPSLSSLF